jgi:hypothetical protein
VNFIFWKWRYLSIARRSSSVLHDNCWTCRIAAVYFRCHNPSHRVWFVVICKCLSVFCCLFSVILLSFEDKYMTGRLAILRTPNFSDSGESPGENMFANRFILMSRLWPSDSCQSPNQEDRAWESRFLQDRPLAVGDFPIFADTSGNGERWCNLWFPNHLGYMSVENRIQKRKQIEGIYYLRGILGVLGCVDTLAALKPLHPVCYRPVRKYMPQPHPLGSGVRLSSHHISRVCTIWKVK